MSYKIKVSYELNIADEKAKSAIESVLKSMMDWIQITDTEWIVFSNRHKAPALQEKLQKLLQSKYSKVKVVDVKRQRFEIEDDSYLDAKNGDDSKILLTNKY